MNLKIIDYLGKILCCVHLIFLKKEKNRERNEKNQLTEKRNCNSGEKRKLH